MSVQHAYYIYDEKETNKQFMNVQIGNGTERRICDSLVHILSPFTNLWKRSLKVGLDEGFLAPINRSVCGVK